MPVRRPEVSIVGLDVVRERLPGGRRTDPECDDIVRKFAATIVAEDRNTSTIEHDPCAERGR